MLFDPYSHTKYVVAHRAETRGQDFIIHAEHEYALEIFGHQGVQGFLAMQIDVLNSAALGSIIIG